MPAGIPAHAFGVLAAIHAKRETPDTVTLSAEIEAQGLPYRAEDLHSWLTFGWASRSNLEQYQQAIERGAELERVRSAVKVVEGHVQQGDPVAALTAMHQALSTSTVRNGAIDIKSAINNVIHKLENPDDPVSLGLDPLDWKLDGGLRPGELMVIAARPRVGKSALALQIILHVARQGVPVSLWTLEMSPEQWTMRALSSLSRIPLRKLRTKDALSTADYTDLTAAYMELARLPIRMADTMDTTPAGWRLEAAREVRDHGAGLLVIDYLQLMQPDPHMMSSTREQQVAHMSRTIKLATLELNVPIIALSQLNREAEDKVPTLANLRESGAMEQDANMVFFIHRELDQKTKALKQEGLGILAKNRDGESGSFPIWYENQHYRFIAMTDKEPPVVY